MKPMISIDFGNAYTKVGLRLDVDRPSKVVTEENLLLDPLRFCVPTVVAAAERSGKTRWEFGMDATKIREGNGIRVYRNWKPQLFDVPRSSDYLAKLFSVSNVEKSGNHPRRAAGEPRLSSPGIRTADLEIREVALRYFSWLRSFLKEPCRKLGIKALDMVPIRLCVPAFQMDGRSSGDLTESEQLLAEILAEAGWALDDECPIVTEPESNAVGIYTEGKNQTWAPYGRKEKKYMKMMEMFTFGGYLNALKNRKPFQTTQVHHVLVVDVGAFTTDFAFLQFDLDQEDRPPQIDCESIRYGIQNLDQLVLGKLQRAKAAAVARLEVLKFEDLKRCLYAEEAPYPLEGHGIIGSGSEGNTIRKCVQEFAEEIAEQMRAFVAKQAATQIREAILTGGGNLIPRVSSTLRDGILNARLDTRIFHFPTSHESVSNARYHLRSLGPLLVRGATALGASSIYFERRLW